MNNDNDSSTLSYLLTQCATQTSITYHADEENALLSSLKPFAAQEQPDEDALRCYKKTLWDLRSRKWREMLKKYISSQTHVGDNTDLIDTVIAENHDLSIDDDTLRDQFEQRRLSLLRNTYPSPLIAFNTLQEEASAQGRDLDREERHFLVETLRKAFNLTGPQLGQLHKAISKQRKNDQQRIIKAKNKRHQEDAKLTAWEKNLVTFHELPILLNATRKEVFTWLAQNRIPVARKSAAENGRVIWEFDPHEIIEIAKQIPLWRQKKGKSKKEKQILRPQDGVDNAALARLAGMDRYAAHFSVARSIRRRITLVTGPTNSGKSHIALQALAEADKGIALAPLRLLAHEFRDTLAHYQVPSSLYTGEERVYDPQATHVCATVEMCPFSKAYDVALIDEAQMLLDPDRGAAWTAALMGVAANHIYVLGAPDCIDMVNRIARLCDEEVDHISLERKTPLRASNKPISLNQVRPGDAVVAFSRREVLDLRSLLMESGHRVSVVYGALSPEVRKAEAACFNNGKSDVLVATDAIGMGLNLSIRRVIFAATQKYDGRDMRPLTPQEVKQIGGRAGRYGRHEEGIVAVLSGRGSPDFIKKMLVAPPRLPRDKRPYIQPDFSIVNMIAKEIHSNSLYGVLARIYRAVLRKDDPNYRMADMEQAFEIASELEGIEGLDLRTRWSYAMCPVDQRNHGVTKLMRWARDHADGLTVAPPHPGFLPKAGNASGSNLEKAEKRYKILLAWRWLALRFPETYTEMEDALDITRYLNGWIEKVLRKQSSMRAANKARKRKRHLKNEAARRNKLTSAPKKKNRSAKKPLHKKRRQTKRNLKRLIDA